MARSCKMSVLFFLLLFASCTGDISDKKVELKTADDSISFAVSMLVSEDMPVAMEELGINDNTLPAFLRGIKDAFPVDESPEAVA